MNLCKDMAYKALTRILVTLPIITTTTRPFTTGYNNRTHKYYHNLELQTSKPLIIAHRGSSGELPEHTLAAYQKAINQHADIIECDVTVTKDLQLICLHENWLAEVTNVAQLYPNRSNMYYVNDERQEITDWFAVDFTLEEIKTLRVKQRYKFRDMSYDLRYEVPTLAEFIELIQKSNKTVGMYPEIKCPSWLNSLPMMRKAKTTVEELVIEELKKHWNNSRLHPCVIKSFHEETLRHVRNLSDLPVALFLEEGTEVMDQQLAAWADIFYAIGPHKTDIIQVKDGHVVGVTDIVSRAHHVGLRVHSWTFRNEDRFLAWQYGQDVYREYDKFFDLKVDGYFTDFPATLYRYIDNRYNKQNIKDKHNMLNKVDTF